MAKLNFPQGFLWGSATAAHQVEGNNRNSDWWQWENSSQRAEQLKKQNKNPEDYKSGIACDSYNRYEEDFDIAKELNHNAHRLSIEWARIQPSKDTFDEKEIEHYAKALKAVKDRGMKTFVTLHHFTNPIWFSDLGAWTKAENVNYFLDYANRITTELKEYIDFLCVINEPNIYAGQSYIRGIWPPQVKNYFLAMRVLDNLTFAHKEFYKFSKSNNMPFQVGTAYAVSPMILKGILKPLKSFFEKKYYLDNLEELSYFSDFIGIQYYKAQRMESSFTFPFFKKSQNQLSITDFGWEIYPEGLLYVLKQVARFKKPIYITENGIADAADTQRKQFITDHIKVMHQAISENIPLKGYLHWSLLDNFEWAEGYTMKFGLVEIDRKDNLKRKIRDSAKYYAQICKNNFIE